MFVQEEVKRLTKSIENESDNNIKSHLIKRKTELENDLKDLDVLKE